MCIIYCKSVNVQTSVKTLVIVPPSNKDGMPNKGQITFYEILSPKRLNIKGTCHNSNENTRSGHSSDWPQ